MDDSTAAYRTRLRNSFAASLALHVLLLLLTGLWPSGKFGGPGPARMAVVLNLQPDFNRPAARLVDAPAPAQRPVAETDLIAEQDSKASDVVSGDGPETAPSGLAPADFDQLPRDTMPPVAAPEPAALRRVQPATEVPAADRAAAVASQPAREEDLLDEAEGESVADDMSKELIQLARAPSEQSDETPRKAQGRVDGGAKNSGFLSFEAMRHELAPYMNDVRDRVERTWLTALQLRYSGTSPTQAVLDVTISPDGKLERVEMVEPGDSVSYAPLCKEAVEKAAPFPPFPFKVPEIYRNQKLEIRWTFSYM